MSRQNKQKGGSSTTPSVSPQQTQSVVPAAPAPAQNLFSKAFDPVKGGRRASRRRAYRRPSRKVQRRSTRRTMRNRFVW